MDLTRSLLEDKLSDILKECRMLLDISACDRSIEFGECAYTVCSVFDREEGLFKRLEVKEIDHGNIYSKNTHKIYAISDVYDIVGMVNMLNLIVEDNDCLNIGGKINTSVFDVSI